MKFRFSNAHSGVVYILLVIVLGLFLKNITEPLSGVHKIRQADTLMSAVIYCYEEAPFMEPRISFRGGMEKGIAIGELPLFSYLMSLPCRMTGQWLYWLPKLVTYLCWLAVLFLLGSMWWPNSPEKRRYLFLLGLSVPLVFSYLLIPIPDSFALFLIVLGVRITSTGVVQNVLMKSLGTVLIVTGILIRPYLIFLLPLFWRLDKRNWHLIFASILSCIGYFWWYKRIALGSEINYYYISMPPLHEMLVDFLGAFSGMLYLLVRDHWSLFGVLLIIRAFKVHRSIFIYMCAVYILIVFLRGHHSNIHQYYYLSGFIISLFLMTEALVQLDFKWRYRILGLMLLSCIVTEQHNWRSNKYDTEKIRKYAAASTDFKDRICVRGFQTAEGFYYALRTGWHNECGPEAKIIIDSKDFMKENR